MRPFIDTGKTCDRCGTAGLEWRQFGARWKLVDLRVKGTGYPHQCSPAKVKKDQP